jgi:aminomethyltransferase
VKRTPLYQRHKDLGARIIDFGGWEMPVQYKDGTIKEHTAVRDHAGIFDVSHMGEAFIHGPRALDAVQALVSNDVGKLNDGGALYTVMCYPDGGIVDDCIVYRIAADRFFIVLNAGNVAKDLAWIAEHLPAGAELDDQSDATALIAVQGPAAVGIVAGLAGGADLAAVPRFHFARAEVAGVPCTACRTGYTGEDGFELACSADDAVKLWDALLAAGCPPIGLGARDTLRLEARLCLYGNDIDQTTNPYEAGLGWVVKLDAKDFVGRDALRAVKAEGPKRKLVGFSIAAKAGIARHGYAIVDRGAAEPAVGTVTSGAPGITVGGAIGLGYAPAAYDQPGRSITIDCRGKDVTATVVKGPFYKR